MILGTASHVGKSTVVAALCRTLHRRSISCAPFKSQNMSLNSYVTKNGGEIGVAQAMQAIAAGIEPDTDMNPILLKPKSDSFMQIVLSGRPYKDLYAGDYYKETNFLLKTAVEAAERLILKYKTLIIEGAGGAAEVNLYTKDIANIKLAQALRLPIILVADIERGGVFAQVYGTVKLLPSDIQPLIKGIIINKFRGDIALFENGRKILEELCNVPVLGVVPATDLFIPSEDSLSIEEKKPGNFPIKIAIIKLHRISNFTDFELLERKASVSYVNPGSSLEKFDVIIIPGTKNTIDDLEDLIKTGTKEEILRARKRDAVIIGICGGYQMLCKTVRDFGIESSSGEIKDYEGLGLIDCTTTFTGYSKTTVQVERRSAGFGPIMKEIGTVTGYEIHMGDTDRKDIHEAFIGEGVVSDDGLLIGTYLHGLFLNVNAVDALLKFIAAKKGIGIDETQADTRDPFDVLSDHFEKYLDIEKILQIIGPN